MQFKVLEEMWTISQEECHPVMRPGRDRMKIAQHLSAGFAEFASKSECHRHD